MPRTDAASEIVPSTIAQNAIVPSSPDGRPTTRWIIWPPWPECSVRSNPTRCSPRETKAGHDLRDDVAEDEDADGAGEPWDPVDEDLEAVLGARADACND